MKRVLTYPLYCCACSLGSVLLPSLWVFKGEPREKAMTEKSCVEILTIIRKIHKMKEELEDLEKRLKDFQESIKTKKPP